MKKYYTNFLSKKCKFLLALVFLLGVVNLGWGQTWNVTSNNNSWGTSTNWSPQTVPNATDAIVNITSDITSDRTVTVNSGITYSLGTLNIGDPSDTFTLGGTTPGTLNFNVTSGSAAINMATNADNQTISAPITLQDNLIITNDQSSGTLTISSTINTNGYLITVQGTGNVTLSGVISGSGSITKTGSGRLTLSGANTYTGATTINAGTLRISADNNLGAAPGTATAGRLVLGGGTLAVTTGFTLSANRGISLTTSTVSTIDVASSQTLIYGGIAAGAGSLSKTSAGTLRLAGNNSYSGETIVNAGTLALDSANERISNSSALTVASGATFAMAGFSETVGSIAGAGTISSASGTPTLSCGANNSDTTFSGIISGTIALTKQGSGTLTLSGTNTYTGATTINAGTLRISADNNLGAAPGTATAGRLVLGGGTLAVTTGFTLSANRGISLTTSTVSTIDVASSQTLIYGGIAAGAGSLSKTSAGTLRLAGNNSYSGETIVNAGTLALDSANERISNSSALTVASGATFAMAGFSETVGSIAGAGTISSASGTPTLSCGANNSDTTFSGIISGTIALTKQGSGTLTLSGTNTYTRLTTISSGVLNIQNAQGTGTTAGGVTVSSGAALELQGGITVGAEALTINNTGVSSGGALRSISGNNTWGGTITLSTNAARINSDAGTLTLSAANSITATNINLTLGGAGNLSVSGTITTGSGTLTKDGNGTLTLSGTNTYTGLTTVSTGVLNIQNAQGTGTTAGGVSVASGAALELQGGITVGAEALTINNTGISSGGALRNISGNNTWGGTITLSNNASRINSDAGTLTLSAANSITATNINLTLGGAGNLSVSGTITTGSGTLTKDGSGTLTLSGANTFTGGTTLNAGTLNINNAGSAGTSSAIGTGTFTIAGGTINNTSTGDITLSTNNAQNWNGDFTYTGGTRSLNLGTGAVTMNASRQVTVSGNMLTVGGVINDNSRSLTKAGAGTLAFGSNNVTIRGLTISEGTLRSTSGTLTLAGDYSNSGTFTHNSGTVTFNGNNALQTVSGSSSTAFNLVTVDKGTAKTNILDVTSVITMATATSAPSLTLTNGSFRLSSASTITPFGGTTSIPAAGGFILNNSSAIVNWGSAGSLTLNGDLNIINGTMSVGTGNNALVIGNTGVYSQSAGTMNVRGRFQGTTSGGSFSLSGGNFNIPTGGTISAGGSSIFQATSLSTFSVSGGTVTISSPNGNTTLPDINITTGTISAGTFVVSDATVTVNSTIPFFNFTVQNGSGTAIARLRGNVTISNDLTLTSGTYDANGFTSTVTNLVTIPSGATYLAKTATQTLNGGLTVSGGTFTGAAGTVTTTNVTLSSGTLTAPSGTFNVSGNWTRSGVPTFNHNNGIVVFNGTDQSITGSNAFYSFNKTVTSGATLTLPTSATQTFAVGGTLTLQGAANNLLKIVSSTPGTQASINPSGTRVIEYVDAKDNNNANGTVITATNSYDAGNLTNWRFNAATLVWTGATNTNWNTPTNWAAGYLPNATDNVTITKTGGGSNLVLETSLTVNNITISGNNTVSLGSNTLTVRGNWLNNGTLNPQNSTVAFTGTTGTQTVNNGASTFNNVTHTGASTLRALTNALNIGGTFTNSAGTFDANSLESTFTGAVTLSGGTYSAGSATQTFNGGLTLSGGTFTGSTGAVTTTDLTMTSGTLTAPSGAFNVLGNWATTGGTFTPGANTAFTKSSGTQTLQNTLTAFNNLTHSGAGTLQLVTSNLSIGGTLTNSAGIFDANGLQTTVTGLTTVSSGTYSASTASQTFNGGLTVSGGTFSGSTGAVTTTDLTMTSGTLTAPSGAFNVSGNWATTGGNFAPGSYTVTFTKSSGIPQTLSNTLTAFNNLTVNGSVGTNLVSDITISNQLQLTTGNLNIGANILTLNGPYISGTTDNLKTTSNSSINFNNTGTGPFNLPNFAAINTLNFNNNLTLSAVSNISVSGNLTITSGIVDLKGFTANRTTAGGTLTLGANGQLKIGGTNTTLTTSTFPSNYNTHSIDVGSTVIYNGENQSVALLNNVDYGNLTLSGTGTKTFAHATATKIRGNFVVDAVTVTAPDQLTFNGVAAQNIAGIAYSNVHFEGTGTKTFTSNASIKSDKAITFASGTGTIDFDGPSNDKVFTFKSDAIGTARVGVVPNGVTLEGKVKVERFIPRGKRAFRFLTPGVTTTNSILANWQNGGDYAPGVGTHITGSSSASGFDATTLGNPSMFSYNNQVASGSGWTQIPNTNGTNLQAGMGYRILIRGDRTSTLITAAAQPEMNVATTLSATGTLTTGRVTYNANTTPAINTTNNTTTNGFSLIGNPYVSPIDWHAVEVSNMQNVYYTWDPNMGNPSQRGRYVAYTITDVNTGVTSVPTSQVNRFIQPGQAFFVKTKPVAERDNQDPPSITFNETNKASDFTAVFRESPSYAKLNISLFEPAELGIGGYALDGVVALYGNSFSNTVGMGDVPKMEAGGENLAIFGNNLKWAMQGSSPIQNNDELLLKTLRLVANKNYTFKINAVNFDASVTAYLVDNFLATTTPINLTQDYFGNFSTTSVVASYSEDRFKIVFQVGTLGTPDFESSISLYPNPSTTNAFYLNIANWTDDIKIRLHNAVGQEIPLTIESSDGIVRYCQSKIDLPVGMYIVTITKEGRTVNKKWLIQR
jgi:autotransporter-associated beta strand protein